MAWHLVLLFIVVRASLDGFKSGTAGHTSALDPASLVGVAFIVFAGLWLIARAGRGDPPASLVTKLLLVLVAWSVGSAALSQFPFQSAVSSSKLFAGVLMFAMLEKMLPGHPERAKQLLGAVVLSAVVPAIIGLHQAISGTGNSSETSGFDRIYATMVNPVSFANYLLIVLLVCVALAAQGTHRTRYVLLSFLMGLLIFWTYTRSAWLVGVVGILLVLFRLNKWLLVPAVFVVIVLPLTSHTVAQRFADLNNKATDNPYVQGAAVNSLEWRFGYWGQVVHLSKHTRITGVGLDNVQRITDLGLEPHNVVIQSYVELGIVGCALFLLTVAAFGRQLLRRRRAARTELEQLTASLALAVGVCVFVEALVTNPLTSTLLWWYIAAAMTWGFTERVDEPEESGAGADLSERPSVAPYSTGGRFRRAGLVDEAQRRVGQQVPR
jgi:O-antigen ligase